MAMARWTLVSLGALIAIGTLGQLALEACGTPSRNGFSDDDASMGSSTGTGTNTSGAGSGAVAGNDDAPGGGSSGGAVSGSSQGSSGVGPSSGGSSSGSMAVGAGDADSYVVRNCAATPCDLRSKTCCTPVDGGIDASYCVNGNQVACGTNTATYHCLSAPDCPATGDVCCGTFDLSGKTATTVCQTGNCGGIQFCTTDGECRVGGSCVAQSCLGVSPLHFCGLQSQAPYNCTAL